MSDGDEIARVLSTKCYYARLNIQRGSTDSQIKTAYRKLAAKVHPDKSRHPRADDAFKAVGQAHAVLSDPDKRAHYDRYGEEESGGMGGGPHVFRANHPEDIFDIFQMFAAGHHPGMRRQRRPQHPHQPHPGINENFAQLLMIPLMFLVAVILFSGAGLNASDARNPFSLNYDLERGYTLRRETRGTAIPYFVMPDFERQYGRSVRDVEKLVTQTYESYLYKRCETEKGQRDKAIRNARTYENSEEMLKQARKMQLPKCKEYKRRFKRSLH